ncbi:MAG TPA: hypothetical protein VGA69_11090, partial [Nitriliruptorales bacterium]
MGSTSADRLTHRFGTATLAGVAVSLLAAACGGPPGQVSWEDVTLVLPEGWVVHEQEPGRFAVTD